MYDNTRYAYDPKGGSLQTDVPGVAADRVHEAHLQLAAANVPADNAAGVHAAITDNGAQQVITTLITSPATPRNITATAGGTATDIKAIAVIVEGTNYAGEVITETLPAFTVNMAGIVTGSKAFKTVTKVTIPAHDGTGATTAIGWGSKLGLPYKLLHNTVQDAFLNNVKEGTAPTVAVSETVLESNTVTLNSALNGSVIDFYLMVY